MSNVTIDNTSAHFPLTAISIQKTSENASTAIVQTISRIANELQSIDQVTCKRDVDSISASLEALLAILPGPMTPEKLLRIDQNIYLDWRTMARNEYPIILDSLLRLIDKDWPGDDSTARAQIIDLFTVEDNYEFSIESFSALTSTKYIEKYPILVEALEKMITSETYLFSLFTDACFVQNMSELEASLAEMRQSHVVQLIVSLPNVVANQLRGKISNIFVPETYSCFLLISLLKSIYFIAESNEKTGITKFNTGFLSKLFSRILIDFNLDGTSQVFPRVIRVIEIWSQKNAYYSTLIQGLLLALNRSAINVISTYLLQCSQISGILGNAVQKSPDWRYCFHTKLPLLSYYKDDRLVVNLVRYLSQQCGQDELYELFVEVLKSWASEISITSHSIDQHIYLTKLLCVSSSFFTFRHTPAKLEEIRRTIYNGVGNHIKSLSPTIRVIGMMTAELLCNKHAGPNEEELHFDYSSISEDDRQIIEGLKKLSDAHEYGGDAESIDEDDALNSLHDIVAGTKPSIIVGSHPDQFTSNNRMQSNEIEYVSISTPHPNLVKISSPLDEDDLDSDDDLEPTDMFNDTSIKFDKSPKYLIDLRENLLHTDDPDIFQASIESCAQLISEKLPNDDRSLGIELLQILIGLDKKFPVDDFYGCRVAGCVAICCVYPKESAEYLCHQFHTEIGKHSVNIKVFMLVVLGESAKSLSTIRRAGQLEVDAIASTTAAPKKLLELNDDRKHVEEAKRIIRERVEIKTRRFASKTTNPFVKAQRNRFADVAGYFFFPLLYGFGKEQLALNSANCALKYDTDNILLITFLHTVATVVLASQNCPIALKFAPEVFGLCSILRFHVEPKVRLGILYTIAAVFMVVPKDHLLTYCFNDICEIQTWLEQLLSLNILRSEKNVECRETAKHVLALCLDIMS